MNRLVSRMLLALAIPLGGLVTGCTPASDDGTAIAAEPQGSGAARFNIEGAGAAQGTERAQTSAQLTDQIEGSRRTAIVQAAARAAPGVATIAVIRSQQVRPSFFDMFSGPRTRQTAGYGSGFVIDGEQGVILTNEHVIRGAERVQVTLSDGRAFDSRIVGVDAVTDVAVIQVDAGSPLPEVPLGTSEGLLIGEWVVAIGNPFGNLIANADPSVTTGVVSATNRHIVAQEGAESFYTGMIQTDAAINPGNSGGPLVNALGQVIGMNSSIFSRSGGSEGLGFAIPIDRALKVADDLLTHGEIRRAWLGLSVEAADADDWGRSRGVMIRRVAGGSPAGDAGLIAGRRILVANGDQLFTPEDWQNVTLDLREGDPITLDVEGQADPVRLVAAAPPTTRAPRVTVLDGLVAITVTPTIQSELGLVSESGAFITSASPGLTSRLALAPGDVLVGFRDAQRDLRVESAEQARDLLGSVPFDGRYAIQLTIERGGRIQSFTLSRR